MKASWDTVKTGIQALVIFEGIFPDIELCHLGSVLLGVVLVCHRLSYVLYTRAKSARLMICTNLSPTAGKSPVLRISQYGCKPFSLKGCSNLRVWIPL